MNKTKAIIILLVITMLISSCVSTYESTTTSFQPSTYSYTPKKRLDIEAIPKDDCYRIMITRGSEYLVFEDEEVKIIVNNNNSVSTLKDAFLISITNKTSSVFTFYEQSVSLYGSDDNYYDESVKWTRLQLLSSAEAFRRMGDVFPKSSFLFSSDIKQDEQYVGYVFIPYESSPNYKIYKLQLEFKGKTIYFLYKSK